MGFQTPRELVRRALTFEHPARVPRDLWLLPWAETHYPVELRRIRELFPPDFITAPTVAAPSTQGDAYEIGEYTDEWGCVFVNIQAGAIGEVRSPLLKELGEARNFLPPYELLPSDRGAARSRVNRTCTENGPFVISEACPRPWERYQFLRGSANAMMDFATREPGALALLKAIHGYYLKELEFWVTTEVDAIRFMDDWGDQRGLLVSPRLWREIFKPLYRDYCDMAHSAGKFAFMHSDGNIQEIFPDLIEVGVDAVNSQLFCMDLQALAQTARGKITFWGEIDRQQILPSQDPLDGRRAVQNVVRNLYSPSGGVIAQLEFGLGANPDVVLAVYDEWEALTRGPWPLS